jgi:CheY-like chemotaxis protein
MATVLVVEDDKLSQRILGKILGGAGHETLVAESVSKAWVLLRSHPLVDLVILDNQLGQEWGWDFLQGLRADVIFTGLPVAVYTAHTERSSIMRYVELGVQAMLVKPYKAEVIFEELKKAVAADWTGRLLERPEIACERLKLSQSDYYSTLSAAAADLEKAIQALRRTITEKRDDQAALKEPLQQIFNQGAALGMPVLKSVTESLVRGLGSKHNAAILSGLRALDSIQQLLRLRSMVYMGVKEVAAGSAPPLRRRTPKLNEAVIPAAASQAAAFCRRTAASPVWAYAKGFGRLEGRELFEKGEVGHLAAVLADKAPLRDMLEAQAFIAAAPNTVLFQVVGAVEELPGFRSYYLRIAAQLGGVSGGEAPVETDDGDDEAQAIRLALDRLGVYRTVVLIAAARVARAARVASPLDLSMLLEHTLTVSILSYEVGRMLRLPEEHLPAAAGLVHDAGKWVMALAEPGLYAITLTLAHEGGQGMARAEQGIFGATHEEVGRLCLEAVHAPVWLLDAAVAHEDLARISKPESAPVVASVYLANHLAWAAVATEEAHARTIRESLLNPDNEVWAVLREANVELPLDIPELVAAMTRVATAAAWISAELVEWAANAKAR